MSSQTPSGDPPPEPGSPSPGPTATPGPGAAESDAETARFPVDSTAPDAPPPPAPDALPTPPPAIISAQPTGWAADQDPARVGPGADAPLVAWAPPAGPAAVPGADGLVIAGVFSRIVAYSADLLLLGAVNVAVTGALGLYNEGRDETLALIVSGVLVGVDFLYFVGLWSSGWQGTLGMRLIKLRVLGANTAGTLAINDALLRWLALSGAVSILTLIPGLGQTVGLIAAAWVLALLLSTAINPLRQGLHDRWARSVVVQPAPGGSGAAFATCLVLVVLVGVILPIAALALAGDQVQEILSRIGNSI